MIDKLIDNAIRRVPDFPKKGILFYDITGIFIKPDVFNYCIDKIVDLYKNKDIDAIAAIESRGFIFASPVASKLNLPLILIRKKGKLPGKTVSCAYKLEYGEAELEMQCCDVSPGQKVLIIDDLVATGGSLDAAKQLVQSAGGDVAGFFSVIGLPFLNYKQLLGENLINTLIEYDNE